MSGFPRTGSAVVVRDGDRLLLARRAKEPNFGKWVFPGGKIEPFESIRQAGERELLEETGLEVQVEDQVGAFECISPTEEHRVIIFSWGSPREQTPVAGSDVWELRFCSREELIDLDLSDIVAQVLRSIGWLKEPTVLAA